MSEEDIAKVFPLLEYPPKPSWGGGVTGISLSNVSTGTGFRSISSGTSFSWYQPCLYHHRSNQLNTLQFTLIYFLFKC